MLFEAIARLVIDMLQVWATLLVVCVALVGLMHLSRRLQGRRRAVLEFQLPNQQVAFMRAARAEEYAEVIREVSEHIRSRLKYGNAHPMVESALETVREVLGDALDRRGLDPWEEDPS